jgi:hypothetical protein
VAGSRSQGIQGHHLLVQELINSPLGQNFIDYLPGWDVNGEYNFGARASNNKIAAQLQIGMHLGSHKWLNEALKDLFQDSTFVNASANEKTKMLGGLVNVLLEAEDPTGVKTNGFFNATSRSDPHLLKDIGTKPDVPAITARTANALNWASIQEMPAYKASVGWVKPTLQTLSERETVTTKHQFITAIRRVPGSAPVARVSAP